MKRLLVALAATTASAQTLSFITEQELQTLTSDAQLTGGVRFKVKRGEEGELVGLQAAKATTVSSLMGCGEASRVFRHSGKHEPKMMAADLDLWYEAPCADGNKWVNYRASAEERGLSTAALRRAGLAVTEAFRRVRSDDAAVQAALGGLTVLEPEYAIVMADNVDHAAEIARGVAAAKDGAARNLRTAKEAAEAGASAAEAGSRNLRMAEQTQTTCEVNAWGAWPDSQDCEVVKCEGNFDYGCDFGSYGSPGWKKRSDGLMAAGATPYVLEHDYDPDMSRMRARMATKVTQWRAALAERDASPGPLAFGSGAEPCEDGKAGEFLCKDVDLVTWTPASQVASGIMNMNWGWTDENGREWLIQGGGSGVGFIDMGIPGASDADPAVKFKLKAHNSGSSTWRDVKTYDHYLLVGSEQSGHGIQIFDLERLDPDHPKHNPSGVYFEPDARYGSVGSCHNVAVSDETGLAFCVGGNVCSGGLHAFDVTDALNPKEIGCVVSGHTHDAQCLLYRGPDDAYYGKEICFVYHGYNGFAIYDISDLNNVQKLSSLSYAGQSYTHQGWLNCAQDTIFMGDETDETSYTKTIVLDIKKLSDPKVLKTHVGEATVVDHNQYSCGAFVYQANYEGGLRILDGSQAPDNGGKMEEVAFFDIYPTRDAVSYKGAWNVWPYFPSGRVVVSDISGGTAVVQPTNLLAQRRHRTVASAGDGVCPALAEERTCEDLSPTPRPTPRPRDAPGADPRLDDQTNLPAIDAAGAWAYGAGKPNIVVQVLDTGLDFSHEEHQINIWRNEAECGKSGDNDDNGFADDCHGYNHADGMGIPEGDPNGDGLGDGGAQSHGTHCAGTIAGSRGNGKGIAGLAGGWGGDDGVRMMTSVGFGKTSVGGFGEAITYAANNGAHISSNSWGYGGPDYIGGPEKAAIEYGYAQGMLIVFAAGNSNSAGNYLPGAMGIEVVGVAATDDYDKRTSFSNYGDWIDISAPGYNVLSTFVGQGNAGDGYQKWSGTSFSCPTVSGMLALGWSLVPDMTREDLLDCLYTTARDIDDAQDSNYKGKMGAGQLNGGPFAACVQAQGPTASPTVTFAPTVAPTSSAPSVSPAPTVLGCGQCDLKGRMVVKTDMWHSETSWKLKMIDPEGLCKHDASTEGGGKDYTQGETVYSDVIKNLCVATRYEVHMHDAYGDGNCCDQGAGYFKFEQEDGTYEGDGFLTKGSFSGSVATGDAACVGTYEGDCKGAAFGADFVFAFELEKPTTDAPSVSPRPTAAPVLVCYGEAERVGDGICDGMPVGDRPDDALGQGADRRLAGEEDRSWRGEVYNSEACGWDGGDCCKCTCEGPECGGRFGDNFARCLDPKWIDKNDWDSVCDGSTEAPVATPRPTTVAERAAFSNEHVVGVSWGPAFVALAWQTPPDSAVQHDWILERKDLTAGTGWEEVPITVGDPTKDHWYLYEAYGHSIKGDLDAFPFDCSKEYLVRIKSPAGKKSKKMVVTVPYCPDECVDSDSWYFAQTYKDCKWIKGRVIKGASMTRLCAKTDASAVSATEACPHACQQCGATYDKYDKSRMGM